MSCSLTAVSYFIYHFCKYRVVYLLCIYSTGYFTDAEDATSESDEDADGDSKSPKMVPKRYKTAKRRECGCTIDFDGCDHANSANDGDSTDSSPFKKVAAKRILPDIST